MVDIVSVLSLQAQARRNAKRSRRVLQRARAQRVDAARDVPAAQARGRGARVGAGEQRTT